VSEISPQDVRNFLDGYGLANANVGVSDEWLRGRIAFSIDHIEKITRQSFTEIKTIEEIHSGNDSNILILSRKPVVELISVTFPNLLNVIIVGKYFIEPKSGIVRGYNNQVAFPRGRENITVKYTYGFTDYPIDIREAIYCFVADKVLGTIANQGGGGSLSVQAWSRDFGDKGKWTNARNDLARTYKSIIKRYSTGVQSS